MPFFLLDGWTTDEEFQPSLVLLVEITPANARGMLRRLEEFTRLKQRERALASLEFWSDNPGVWIDTDLTQEFDDLLRDLYDKKVIQLSPDKAKELHDAVDAVDAITVRVDVVQEIVTTSGVSWAAYVKHTDVKVESSCLGEHTLREIA